jgi:Fe-S-cluster-containing dehydrogenase component/DMSO reductase anchor subunit
MHDTAAGATPVPAFRDGELLGTLLAEQQTLDTAVSRFARWHERNGRGLAPAETYHRLLPAGRPGAGEQYAFEVRLDDCTGCKACVTACHSLNGLDPDESWRDVGAVVSRAGAAQLQTVTTACHHCADPACANGCPVLAYEKDEDTGVVRHLDDQCIGCSYCILKCPYGVPKFNRRLGIVRKCDMCADRLAEGEAPACVQACPNGAIRITVVRRADTLADPLMPGCVDSTYTRPTTRYLHRRGIDHSRSEPVGANAACHEPAHWPLVGMLVLTQVAAGLFATAASGDLPGVIAAANACLLLGLGASILHLGQPLRAWRVFLGWRKSWLSREILAFGGFAAAGVAGLLGFAPAWLPAVAGAVAIGCSVMVYVDTRRPDWSLVRTGTLFAGTCVVSAVVAAVVVGALPAGAAAAMVALKAAAFYAVGPSARRQRLVFGPLGWLAFGHLGSALLGAVGFLIDPRLGLVATLAAEVSERALFFRSARAWGMPGH